MHASACARKRGRPAADGSHGPMSTALPPTPRTPCSAALGVHYAATASAPPPPSPPHAAGASCKARTASWVGCAREAHLQWRACVGGLCRAASIAAEALAHLIILCVQHKPAAIPNILKHLHRYVCVSLERTPEEATPTASGRRRPSPPPRSMGGAYQPIWQSAERRRHATSSPCDSAWTTGVGEGGGEVVEHPGLVRGVRGNSCGRAMLEERVSAGRLWRRERVKRRWLWCRHGDLHLLAAGPAPVAAMPRRDG